jgi:hypothetical protein
MAVRLRVCTAHHRASHRRCTAGQGLHSVRSYDRLASPLARRDMARRRAEGDLGVSIANDILGMPMHTSLDRRGLIGVTSAVS